MKTLQVSDELFEKLKDFVVDPFEDTPEVILDRLMEIVSKAKRKWSPVVDEWSDQVEKIEQEINDVIGDDDESSGDLRYRPAGEAAALS